MLCNRTVGLLSVKKGATSGYTSAWVMTFLNSPFPLTGR